MSEVQQLSNGLVDAPKLAPNQAPVDAIIGKEVKYQSKTILGSQIRSTKIVPTPSTAAYNIDAASTQEVLFKIPARAFRPAKCQLTFLATPAADNANFNWVHVNSWALVNQIILQTESGVIIDDLRYVHRYTNAVRPLNTRMDEFVTRDPSSTMAKNTPALGGPVGPRYRLNEAIQQPFLETNYLQVGAAGANATPVIRFEYKFADLADTFWGIDHPLWFGQVLELRVLFGPANQYIFTSPSGVDPFTNSANHTVAQPVVLTDMFCDVAVEANSTIVGDLVRKLASGGHKLLMPHCETKRTQVLTSQSHLVTFSLKRSLGSSLKRMVHAIYHRDELRQFMYYHSQDRDNALNLAVAGAGIGVGGCALDNYTTRMDGDTLQAETVNMIQDNDYKIMYRFIKGTPLALSKNVWRYSWVHVDDFSLLPPRGSDYDSLPVNRENIKSGLDLYVGREWEFNGASAQNYTVNHYSFACLQRTLEIMPGAIRIT